ncbi:hypothetical protein [Roseibacillus ishigakijimensis]|uniref:Uncharacterized protein n=1 Tax=Roseibacillus ishigakijimensis TaxID=454146 RepID=A0A934VLL3_9BACT|nr:hypothetical protein [Roseibacillus ishigakijimensis]MBK1833357.1 hypothetical protein [Roseibacillus ishigakijimensis]
MPFFVPLPRLIVLLPLHRNASEIDKIPQQAHSPLIITEIRQIGDHKGVILDEATLAALGLEVGDQIV